MRLGGTIFATETVADLDRHVDTFDDYGLSAVTAPRHFAELGDDELAAFRQRAGELGLVIGEALYRPNLMIRDLDERARRIAGLRHALAKAEVLGAHAVVILVGSIGPDDHLAEPHPYMYTADCQAEFGDIVLRSVEGLDLPHVKLAIEPWTNTFFYQPAPIREFLDRVDHPSVALHLDLMNMVDQYHYFRTTELIDETFDLLGSYIAGVHFKDVRWDWRYMYMKFDEVPVGDGVIDYTRYLRRLGELEATGMLGAELAGYCEHYPTVGDYAVSFARLRRMAGEVGLTFLRRAPVGAAVA